MNEHRWATALRVGILIDNGKVTRWQAESLATLPAGSELIVYNCTRRVRRGRRLRHGLYHALNLAAIRNPMTRAIDVEQLATPIRAVRSFELMDQALWQRLPTDLLDAIAQDQPDVVLRLGLELLHVPPKAEFAPPLLSYHHGDPDRFRGRPAGFFEIQAGEATMGQIVQILSNGIDNGPVVASCETRIHPHSYRATLIESYRHSPLILMPAIRNALRGRTLPRASKGRNYRLPGNLAVLGFCAKIAAAWCRRLLAGAFLIKAWRVALTELDPQEFADHVATAGFPTPERWRDLPLPSGYSFIADPFFHPKGDGLLVEAMPKSGGAGQLLHLDASRAIRLSDPAYHHSYPCTITHERIHYVIPEIAEWSPLRLFRLEGGEMAEVGTIEVENAGRLTDPTLYAADGSWYLFANQADEGNNVLRLWCGEELAGPYVEHPDSPVGVSPIGGRMAGAILDVGGARFRLGQNCARLYGDGLALFRIETLSRTAYEESPVGALRFADVRGPHTLNFQGGEAVFDWYRQRFNPFAGVQRLQNLLRARGRASMRGSTF